MSHHVVGIPKTPSSATNRAVIPLDNLSFLEIAARSAALKVKEAALKVTRTVRVRKPVQ